MLKAVIDLGTNTFNLLIAEVSNDTLNIVHSEKIAVMLGLDGINQNLLTEEAKNRALIALEKFTIVAEKKKVKSIIGIGTSALRGAKNSNQFCDEVYTKLGLNIQIITGLEEAEYIYNGVLWLHNFKRRELIMDIGGGSTEFIVANDSGVEFACSADIGVSRVFQMLNKPSVLSNDFVDSCIRFFDENVSKQLLRYDVKTLIGSSGSFETFYEMIYKRKFSASSQLVNINKQRLLDVINWTINSSLEEREEHEWIVPMRKEMLPIAALKIKWIIDSFEIDEIFVSPYSLKEGAFRKNLQD